MPTPSKKRMRFYNSSLWKKAKEEKKRHARGLCEKCGRPGYEVHHIIPLTDDNVEDPTISINLDNLMLLCTSCHNKMRVEEQGIRSDVRFDEHGNVYFTS